VSLRTSVGNVARAQAPFASWLRESILAVPVFVFAVLGALTLALSWFAPHRRRPKSVVATSLLVVAAGTVAGVAWLTASSAYDYHLQVQQLEMMGSMGGRCTGDCLARQQHASLLLQVRSVGYGSGILLVTNLAVVGWVVAVRGGQLDAVAIATHRRVTGALARRSTRTDALRLVLAVGLLGSAAVHAGMVVAGRSGIGLLAMALTAAQSAVAVQLLARPTRTGPVAAAVVSAGPLVVTGYSLGPFGPFGPPLDGAHPVGLADAMACVLQIGTLAAAVLLLTARRWLERPPPSAHQVSLALVAVLALTVLGLAGTGLAWFDVLGTSGDHAKAMTHD
jgi:hypothetical protein